MEVKPRTRAGLLFALIPLAFLTGFTIYAQDRYQVPRLVLVTVALCAAAVPLTVSIVAVSRR